MSLIIDNNVLVTLSAPVLVGATSITVNKASSPMVNPPDPDGGLSVLTLTDSLRTPTKIEIITYTGRTDDGAIWTLTGVSKAQEGTADQAWSAGDSVLQAATKGVFTGYLLRSKADVVEGIVDLLAISEPANKQQVNVLGYYTGSAEAGSLYHYSSALAKSNHDGVAVISNTVPWDGEAGTLAAFLAGTGETDSGGNGCWVRVDKTFALPEGTTLSPTVLQNNGVRFVGLNSAGGIKNFGALMSRIADDTEGSEAGEIYVVVNDVDALVAVWKWDQNGAAISDVGAPGGIMSVGPGGERISAVERDYVDARPIGVRNLRDIDPGDLADLTFRVGYTATMYNASKVEKKIGAIRWRYLNRTHNAEKAVQFSTLLNSGAELDVQSLYAEGAWVFADPAISGGNEVVATLFPDDIIGIGSGRGALVGSSGSALLVLVGDGAVADGGGPFGLVFAGRITTGSGKTGRSTFASITGVKANGVESDGSGRLEFKTQFGLGGLARRGYAERGFVWGTPTGGDRGDGTINAQAVYDDNVLLTDYVFDLYVLGTTPDKSDVAESYRRSRAKYADVDAFIDHWKRYQHMPSMPSREEWKKDGSKSVGDIVQRLWETVELQALHISQLRDEISELRQRIK